MTFLILFCLLSNFAMAKDYRNFSTRSGKLITTDRNVITVRNLTLMSWDWDSGRVKVCIGTSKLRCKDIEIEMHRVRSIDFEKTQDSDPKFILFYAVVTLKNGTKRKILMDRVYNNGMNNPYYSFVGKSDFGIEEIKLWDVKYVEFYD